MFGFTLYVSNNDSATTTWPSFWMYKINKLKIKMVQICHCFQFCSPNKGRTNAVIAETKWDTKTCFVSSTHKSIRDEALFLAISRLNCSSLVDNLHHLKSFLMSFFFRSDFERKDIGLGILLLVPRKVEENQSNMSSNITLSCPSVTKHSSVSFLK